jgi:hypothetical protein
MSKGQETKLNVAFWGVVLLFNVAPKVTWPPGWIDRVFFVGASLFFLGYVVRYGYLLLRGEGDV